MGRIWMAAASLLLFASAARADWVAAHEPTFGARIAYPDHVFTAYPSEPGDPELRFMSTDGLARLAVSAWLNSEREIPGVLKSRLLERAHRRSLTYDPRGRSWFVLSGYQGENIYYQKVMYTCGGRAISAFGLTYPRAERHVYDPIVERMEDSFRPGRNCPPAHRSER